MHACCMLVVVTAPNRDLSRAQGLDKYGNLCRRADGGIGADCKTCHTGRTLNFSFESLINPQSHRQPSGESVRYTFEGSPLQSLLYSNGG
jgi:hypothetical protein